MMVSWPVSCKTDGSEADWRLPKYMFSMKKYL